MALTIFYITPSGVPMASRVLNRQLIRPNFEPMGMFHQSFELPPEDLVTKMARQRLSAMLTNLVNRRAAPAAHDQSTVPCSQFLLIDQNPSVSDFDFAWQTAPLTPEIEAHGYDQVQFDAMCTPIEFIPGVGFIEKEN